MEVALIGNPNCGKTSIFNVLTGSNQKVGNWPGVTVEKKQGILLQESEINLIDLPGIYSLTTNSPEEEIAKNYLLKEKVDVIINLVDGTNLERNLYLTLQLLELNIPVIIAINMCDLMEQQNISIDLKRLEYQLDTSVIAVSAAKKIGLESLIKEIKKKVKTKVNLPRLMYSPQLEALVSEVEHSIKNISLEDRFLIISMLEDQKNADFLTAKEKENLQEICNTGQYVLKKDLLTVIIDERYQAIEKILHFSLYTKNSRQRLGRLIDKIVTNQWLAFPIFILIMWFVYYLSIQTIGTFCTDWINDVLLGTYIPNFLTNLMKSIDVSTWLQDLVLNGIVAGVGSVIGFLPQIAVLFLCLNILEDCGYMARIAFVMDRIFRYFGLSGKSFIPLLISTGCGVPGIMATRTIENPDERKMTILLSTFLPCSAKTAVIALIVGAFFEKNSFVAPSVYVISLLTIVISGLLLKNSPFFHRDESVFVMELPDYHIPHWPTIFRQTWIRCLSFVKKAASIIFVSSVILWIMSNCNWTFHLVSENNSILADLGRFFSFIFLPIGFGKHWQATVAVLTSFSAKENIINTLGILYHQTINSESGIELWQILRTNYTSFAAFSFLIFNVLCTPCFAAIGAMKRELGSNLLAFKVVFFQCGMAYIISFIIYQLSIYLVGHVKMTISTLIAFFLIILIIFSISKKVATRR